VCRTYSRSFPTRRSSDLWLDLLQQFACPPDGGDLSIIIHRPQIRPQRVELRPREAPPSKGAIVDCRLAGDVDGVVGGVCHAATRSEEHTSELQSRENLVC